jgi:hypothetical protein
MAMVAAEGIIARLQGKMPNHVVNKAVLEKLDLAD